MSGRRPQKTNSIPTRISLMSNAETTKDLVGQSIREIKRGIDTLADFDESAA